MSCNEAAMAEEVPKRRGLACAGATCGPLIIDLQLLLALALCTLRLVVLGLALQHAPQPLRLRSTSSGGPVYLATFTCIAGCKLHGPKSTCARTGVIAFCLGMPCKQSAAPLSLRGAL